MMNLLTPPIFDDEDKTLVAHHLFIILWTCMAVGWLAILMAMMIPGTVYRWLLLVGVIESTGLILLAINKYGHTRLVSSLLIFVIWATATGMALTGGGTSSNAMAIYFVVVLVAGLVLSGKAGMITAVFCSLTGLFFVYLEYSGMLPVNRVSHTPLTLWISNTIYMAIIISLQYLVSRTIRKALKQSRQELMERKLADEALRESQAFYHSLVEQLPAGVFRKDREGRFVFVSPWFCRLKGMKEEQFLGKIPQEVATNEAAKPDATEQTIKYASEGADHHVRIMQNGNPIELIEEYMDAAGRKQFVHVIKIPVFNSEGKPIGTQGILFDITERKRMEEALRESEQRYRELSIVDGLTHLYNSRHFYFQLKIELDRSNRYGQPLTLLLLDLDNFKAFNDAYGHVEGDQVLWRLGQVVKRCLRETDFAFRYGGEEFTIVLPMTGNADGAVTAERIRTELRKETFSPTPDQQVHVTVSIGLAQYKPQEEMKAFVHRVDQLMYQGKKNGKDRICCEHNL